MKNGRIIINYKTGGICGRREHSCSKYNQGSCPEWQENLSRQLWDSSQVPPMWQMNYQPAWSNGMVAYDWWWHTHGSNKISKTILIICEYFTAHCSVTETHDWTGSKSLTTLCTQWRKKEHTLGRTGLQAGPQSQIAGWCHRWWMVCLGSVVSDVLHRSCKHL